MALEQAPKTQESQVYQCDDIASFGPKSRRAKYGEGQRDGEDEKIKKDWENGRDEKSGRDYCGNKVNLIIGKSSDSEASVYHYIIYWYYQRLIVLGWDTGSTNEP